MEQEHKRRPRYKGTHPAPFRRSTKSMTRRTTALM